MKEIKDEEILAPLRAEIDAIDRELIALIGRRFEVVRRVGEIKAEHALEVVQGRRAAAVLESAGELAQQNGLSPDFVKSIYRMMIEHAHSIEFAEDRESGHG